MKPKRLSLRQASITCSTIFVTLTAATLEAGQIWDGGGGDDNWNTPANWDGNALPTFTNPISFTGNTRNTPANDLAADSVIGGLNFTNDGSTGKTNAFTLSGARITLGGNITTTANTAGSTITDTISLDMILNANRTITTNQLSGSVQHNLTISGIISQDATPRSLTKAGLGTLTLSNANSYTGATIVNQGTLILGSGATGSLSASSALQMGGGTFTYSRTGTGQTLNGLTVSAGGSTINNTVSGQNLILGAITRTVANRPTINFGDNTGGIIGSFTNVNGIIGPWASFGTGTNTRYAVSNGGASAITGLAGTDIAVGSIGSAPTANYNVSAVGTLGANASVNTLRYTGAAGNIAGDLITTGLMNAGSGELTFTGAVKSAATGNTTEMVINTANGNIQVNTTGVFTGTIVKTGSGNFSLGASGAHSVGGWTVNEGVLIMARSSSDQLPGGTVNSGGEMRFGTGGEFNNSAIFTINAGGTVNIQNLSDTIGGISGAGTLTGTTGGSLNFANGTNTFSGNITGDISIRTTANASAQVLSGASDYSGGTQIQAGYLQLGNSAAAGTGAIQLGHTSGGNSAELRLSGTGTNVANDLNVVTGSSGAKTLRNGSNNTVTYSGIITANDNLTIAGANSAGGFTINNAGNSVATGKTVSFVNTGSGGTSVVDSALWSGDGALSYTSSTAKGFTVSGAKTYTGGATLGAMSDTGILVVNTSSTGPANAPTDGAFGTGTLSIGATKMRGGTTANITIGNAVTFTDNPTFTTVAAEKSLIFSGNVSLGATRTLTVETGSTVATEAVEFSGEISGSGFGITKEGAGNLLLSGNNTFTGGVTINAGVLQLGNAGALNSTAGSENAVTFGASSTGILSLAGNSVTIRSLTSNATPGTPVVQNANAGNATLTVGNSLNLASSFAGVIQNGSGGGTLGLTKAGTNSLTLSGLNSFTGDVTVSDGTLVAAVSGSGGNSALGGSLSAKTINVNTGGILRFDVGNVFNNDFSSLASALPTLNIAGGTMTNGGSATNSALGNITLADGTLDATTGSPAGTASGQGYGSWNLNGTVTSTGTSLISSSAGAGIPITLNATNGLSSPATIFDVQSGTLTVSAVLGQVTRSGNETVGSLTKDGAGTMVLSGTNTYTGETVIKAGTLKANTSTTIGSSSKVTVGDTGSSGTVLDATAAGLTVGATQTLAGIGTVDATGQTVTIAGTLAPGNSAGTLSMTVGNLDLGNSTALAFELNPSDTTVGSSINDLVAVTGNLNLDGLLSVVATSGDFLSVVANTSWRLFNYSGTLTDDTLSLGSMPSLGSGLSWSIDTATTGQVNLVVIPEPRAALLGGLGLLALLRRRR